MKNIIVPFFCAVLLSGSLAAQTKSSDKVKAESAASQVSPGQVLDSYFKALGGKEKLEAVKTMVTSNTISAQGMEVTMTTKKMGNKFRSEQKIMGQTMTQVFDGEKGYFEQGGVKKVIPMEKIGELKNGKTVDALAFESSKFSNVSTEKLDNKTYHVLSSDKGKFYFDVSTGLLSKSEAKEGMVTFNRYMTVDGLKFPAEISAGSNGQNVVITTTNIVLNSGVTEADFQ